jgi:hypothetical protein
MDAFVRNNVSLVLSTVYLLICCAAAAYATVYIPKSAAIEDLKIANQLAEKENRALATWLRSQKKVDETIEARINSIPAFLQNINSLANTTNVIIRKLAPDERNKLKFYLEMFSDYYTFVKFTSQLESLSVTIHDLEVRPYNDTKTPPVHLIKFTITPTDDAAPLSSERLRLLANQVDQKNKRNPFQRYAARTGPAKACIDQTWVFRLSGIGTVNNIAVATIGSVDYKVGDRIADMTIRSIKAGRVELQKKTENGTECHLLKFRKKKKARRR